MCIPASKRMLWFVISVGLSACGEDLTLPADGKPSSLLAVSGDGQEATIGSELPEPLIVRLTDAGAHPISGIALEFRFQTEVPAAKVDPSVIATDDTGYAAVRVRLGSTAGAQTIEARLVDDQTTDLSASFDVTALAKKDDHKGNRDGGRAEGGNGDDGKGKDKGKGNGGGHDDEHED
jgi:hypothetical protein